MGCEKKGGHETTLPHYYYVLCGYPWIPFNPRPQPPLRECPTFILDRNAVLPSFKLQASSVDDGRPVTFQSLSQHADKLATVPCRSLGCIPLYVLAPNLSLSRASMSNLKTLISTLSGVGGGGTVQFGTPHYYIWKLTRSAHRNNLTKATY